VGILFLYDIKHTDAHTFASVTGGDLPLVLENLAMLPPAKVVLRVPVIPGFNFSEAAIRSIYDLALAMGIRRIDLLPYHTLGVGKYAQLGVAYPYGEHASLTKQSLAGLLAIGEARGLTVT